MASRYQILLGYDLTISKLVRIIDRLNQNMNQQELNQVIAQCQKHGKQAFTQLIESYKDYVFRLAYRILLNTDEANDVLQDTFLKVWLNIGGYKSSYKFTTWLYQIVNNICIDKLRKQELQRKYEATVPKDAIDQTNDTFNELIDLATQMASELPTQQRICFVLRDLEELEMNEVADITGLNRNQVKSNLYYARKQVREKLKQVYKYQP